jgi:hypothetical protein
MKDHQRSREVGKHVIRIRFDARLTERSPEEEPGKSGSPPGYITRIKDKTRREVRVAKNPRKDSKLRWKIHHQFSNLTKQM